VLSGLDALPPSINLWRHLTIWLGGMGIIVLMVAVLPMLGVGGRQLFKAEMPGPMKDSKLTPRITETAKALWLIYFGLTLACALAYRAAGMSWLDAVMHAFTTCALGGFSSHDDSMGFFNSPVIEGIAMTFMLLSGINYATHFLALRGINPAVYLRDPEVKFYLGVLLVSVVMLSGYLWYHGTYPSFWTALRYASFNTISVATTTGYATTDYYGHWPIFASLWMLFLCSFISCSGSTGGGIKMMRAIILYKVVYREFVKLLHPSATVHTKLADHPLPSQTLYSVLAFAFIYMCSIATLTLLMAASGQDLVTGFSAIVASINNTGPGLHKVGPATTFLVLTDFQTWLCTFAMLLGRLELFALLIVFTPAFWRK
jgi:trk system potassium uptake protein TrkH